MTTPDRSGWRVLVIEDDGLIAMDISDTLDQLGHVVVGPMRTVESALATIDNQVVDLAFARCQSEQRRDQLSQLRKC